MRPRGSLSGPQRNSKRQLGQFSFDKNQLPPVKSLTSYDSLVVPTRKKNLVTFLRQHGGEVYREVRAAYSDTMGRVLRQALTSYVQALWHLQLDIAGRSDLLAVGTSYP